MAGSHQLRGATAGQAGASLVELLLAMAVVGILAAVTFPGFAVADSATARSQAAALAAEIRLARQQAITRDADCWVSVEPAAGRYQLGCADGYAGGTITLPEVVEIRYAPASQVRFSSQGLLTGGAGAIGLQARRGGPTYQVQVRTQTGEVWLGTQP